MVVRLLLLFLRSFCFVFCGSSVDVFAVGQCGGCAVPLSQ